MSENFMAQLGMSLIERGYAILPLQPQSKKPGRYRLGEWQDYPKWSRHCERDTTENEVDIWADWPQAGIGIAAGKVIGIDIDVQSSATLAHDIEALAMDRLGKTPAIRIGKAPKRLLVYRAAEPFRGFKYPPIEVLGLHQQFVGYAIHPETGQAYDWPVDSLADIDLEDLPAITEVQARAFAEAAYALIPVEERPRTLATEQSTGGHSCAVSGEQRGTHEAVEAGLGFIPNDDLDYDSWIRIGLAIKGALGDAGWSLFDAWSATSQKHHPDMTARSWQSFKPDRIGAGTIYRLAIDRGWVPAANLKLNGEITMQETHPAQGLIDRLKGLDSYRVTPKDSKLELPEANPLPAGWDNVGGLLGDMMDLMITTAKRPQPVLALGASLCAIGALMGRKYRTESNIRSNLYVVGIAESGAGKNHSRVVINEVFRQANLLQYLGGNKIASGSGLLTAVQRQPSILFQLDEFGMFLTAAADRKRSPRYLCEILDLMTELYTTAGTSYFGVEYASNLNNNAHRAIHQPCACFYGTTTPVHFWQALQATNMADGSLARFLILQSEEDFPDSNRNFGLIKPSRELVERVQWVHKGGGKLEGNLTDVGSVEEVMVKPRVVPSTLDAREAFQRLDKDLLEQLRQSRGTGYSSILARIEENASKLALIRAVSRDPVDPQIEGQDAEWGIMLSRHCAELTIREASARVSENTVESHHKRALQILADAGEEGMPRSEFTRRTQFMDHRQREGVLHTLVEAKLVESIFRPSKGRPVQWITVMPRRERV